MPSPPYVCIAAALRGLLPCARKGGPVRRNLARARPVEGSFSKRNREVLQ